MKLESAITVLTTSILLAGCASGNVGLRAGNASSIRAGAPPPGTSYSAAVVHAEASPNAYFGMLIFGSAMLGLGEDYGRPGGGASSRRPPEMAEGRAIVERDCRQPLGPVTANLRCK
jgi:hypothetical protein